MNSMAQAEYDARITVHDLYLIILWDTSYFEPRPQDKRICGRRVAEGLFSVEAFASNARPEHKISRALAEGIRPQLTERMKLVEGELKQSLEALDLELKDPLTQAVEVALPTPTEYPFTVEKGKGGPMVNSLIRLFVLADHITASLKELNYRGVISKRDYKKREDEYSKPLRKLLNDFNIIIKNYHKTRKEIIAG
ncbi:TIGR03761 family integrating conjugative element protein [Pseudomonas putida]|nr:TIGR03761 family integrating conjugative element protein [Pseudomonas putida]